MAPTPAPTGRGAPPVPPPGVNWNTPVRPALSRQVPLSVLIAIVASTAIGAPPGDPMIVRPKPIVPLGVQAARNPAAQVVAPGQQVAQPMRQREYPLPDGDIWEDVVDEVRRPFGHAPATSLGEETLDMLPHHRIHD